MFEHGVHVQLDRQWRGSTVAWHELTSECSPLREVAVGTRHTHGWWSCIFSSRKTRSSGPHDDTKGDSPAYPRRP